MKKLLLILITILITTYVYAHSTDEYMPQFMNFFKENLL